MLEQQHEVARRGGLVGRPPKAPAQAAAEAHPLDPLSAQELETVSCAVLAHAAGLGIASGSLRFNTIGLQARALAGCLAGRTA